MSAIITLTTDFGTGSPYIAAMKGVMLGINPAARLVDVSHEIGAQNIRQGAVVLAEASTWFPAGTLHVGVVDPGVGTARRLIYARLGDQQYLAPDNGLLSLLAKRSRSSRIIELKNNEHWLPSVSSTFHGRDILAPVAAQLSLGLEAERLGPVLGEMQILDWPEATRRGNRIDGIVQWIDSFGNLISNISAGMLVDLQRQAKVRIQCGHQAIDGINSTYAQQITGSFCALIGSSGYLEIAVVNGSAKESLGVSVGDAVVVQ
jgi:S-adenosyl-L-methionine hydrolase (adenosine-forming)